MCRPPDNSTNDRIVQRWGVYHTSEEFFQKAAKAGHPQSLDKNSTSIDRRRKRTTIMRDWVRRAELLKSSELELKSKFDPHAKQILSDKRYCYGSPC